MKVLLKRYSTNQNLTNSDILWLDILNKEFITGHQENFTQDYQKLSTRIQIYVPTGNKMEFPFMDKAIL